MGVMECFRNGCTNILCDLYSSEFGYICNECFIELTEQYEGDSIEEFLKTNKNGYHKYKRSAFVDYCKKQYGV